MPSSSVEVVHDLLIPTRDGVRLAANLYRPAGGGRGPCLVNYLPYHKDGRGGLWYDEIHRFFAGRGYASLVVDFRGLGCSEGVNNVPFDAQEGRDGHDAVEWAAAQPWCDGNVGMWGTSYGGITSLKAAAQRPPHLKAIVTINATWDNYTDFLLLGGCRSGFWPNGDWGPRMIAYNLTPPLAPDPDGRLDRLWRERLERSTPWCLEWYDDRDEARWAGRAIPVERIAAATYAVCGWKDFYVQGTFDYFRRIGAPKKLLMGPWKHIFPNLSPEEPVDLLEIMVRWWDRWLRGQENGAESGPPITLFVGGADTWRQESSRPPERNDERTLCLCPDQALAEVPPSVSGEPVVYAYDPTVGLDSLGFDPWTSAVVDQGTHNGDDGRSLYFATAPLEDDWEMTGQARAVLVVGASAPGLTFTVKLCDVGPGGRSRLVTMGWAPGLRGAGYHSVEVALRAAAHVFRRGHRIRVSVALADFPRLWPTPQKAEVSLDFDIPGNPPRLMLPRTPRVEPPLPAPELPPPGPAPKSSAELETTQTWSVGRELVQQTAEMESSGISRYRLRDGGEISYAHAYTAKVAREDPAGAAIHVHSDIDVQRPGGHVMVRTVSVFTPTSVEIHVEVRKDGETFLRREWKRECGS